MADRLARRSGWLLEHFGILLGMIIFSGGTAGALVGLPFKTDAYRSLAHGDDRHALQKDQFIWSMFVHVLFWRMNSALSTTVKSFFIEK